MVARLSVVTVTQHPFRLQLQFSRHSAVNCQSKRWKYLSLWRELKEMLIPLQPSAHYEKSNSIWAKELRSDWTLKATRNKIFPTMWSYGLKKVCEPTAIVLIVNSTIKQQGCHSGHNYLLHLLTIVKQTIACIFFILQGIISQLCACVYLIDVVHC